MSRSNMEFSSSNSKTNGGVKNREMNKKKKSKKKLEFNQDTENENCPALSNTSGAQTLLSLFAKAKPPSYVTCPVCSCKVDHAFINQHLDRGCVTVDRRSVLSNRQEGEDSTSSKSQSVTSATEEAGIIGKLKRKIADVKDGSVDKRKRDRLSRKYQSHSLYQSDSAGCDSGSDRSVITLDSTSDQSLHMLDSHSWIDNKDDRCTTDFDSVSSLDSLVDLENVQSSFDHDREGDSQRTCSSLSSAEQSCGSSTGPHERLQTSKPRKNPSHGGVTLSFSDDDRFPLPSSITVSVNKKMKLQRPWVGNRISLKRKRQDLEDTKPSVEMQQSLSQHNGDGKETSDHKAEVKEITSLPHAPQETNSTPVKSPTGSQRSTSLSPTKSPHKAKEPYYVSNFKFVLNTVLGNEDDRSLCSEEDLHSISLFNELSVEGQQLYIRIFQRKLAWLRISKLQYPRIAEDLMPIAEEVCQKGLFLAEDKMDNLEEVLRQLPAPDIKLLIRELKVSCPDGTQKSDMVTACLRHCKKQRGLFGASLLPFMLKKAKMYLGPCIKLCQKHRAVFTRICLLFSPVLMTDDEENASGGQNQLQALMLVNFGRVIYPAYQINRTKKIFRHREELIRYETALQYEHDILGALSTNDFELANKLWQAARSTQMELLEDGDTKEHVRSLPIFLQYFTALSVYEHIHYLGVEILQKQRRYQEAVEELKRAIVHCEFRKDSRGSRWDRLALNLDQHLKDPEQALDSILEGLADEHVQTGHRLALEQRAEKILSAAGNKKLAKRRKEEFNLNPLTVKDLPSITIQGKILPYTGPGVKNTFFREASNEQDEDGVELCSVEQVAIDYYLRNGYTHGKHGEGTTFSTLIFLLFWDEVFMDIPDVFSYPYQSGPLDLRTHDFFPNREEALRTKLEMLKESDEEALQNWLEQIWTEHNGEACAGINWDILTLEEAKDLIGCMGGEFISATAERLLRSHRHCRGGMPDLVVWNTQTRSFKMSEVKGPGDRLSHKQILWIDFFRSIGSDVEVCHVQGLQAKNLKHRQLERARGGSSSRTPRKSPKNSPSKSPQSKKTPTKMKQKQM